MPLSDRIELDTNCLLAALSKHGRAYPVWQGFQEGRYTFCVTTEILNEYEEIIAQYTRPEIARNVLDYIIQRTNVELIVPYFHLNLITSDPDDNKFVDCVFAANATFIVSDDKHYDVLKVIPFPQLIVLKLKEFIDRLVAN